MSGTGKRSVNVRSDYFSGQRKRTRLKRQRALPEAPPLAMPHLTRAMEAQNRLLGTSEALFGSPSSSSDGHVPRVPLLNSPEVQLRFLNPSDVDEVKRLCREWFPIEYPDAWYADITSDERFYSVCSCYRGRIIGLIVAEIKDAATLPKEDSEILASSFGRKNVACRVGYILSLGNQP